MPRVKRGTHRRANRKKTLALASGFFLTKSKLYRAAQEAVEKSLADPANATADLQGTVTTTEMGDLIAEQVRSCPLESD